MKIIADTNVLVRAAMQDDRQQALLAARSMHEAEIIAVTLPALCEFVWVLRRGYKRSAAEVASAICLLTHSASVVVDRPAVDAGLAVLEAGGDFSDGLIAFEGLRLGGAVFVTFDRQAATRVRSTGTEARLLGTSRSH